MNIIPIRQAIRQFVENFESDQEITSHDLEHQQRIANAQRIFHQNYLENVSREDLEEFLKDTDAFFGVRGKVRLFRELFGEEGERLPGVRALFSDLIQRAEVGLTPQDLNEIRPQLRYIGDAFLSEILSLRFPVKYWIWNGQVRRFLEGLGVDIKEDLPYGKKGDRGEQYFAAGKHIVELRRALSEVIGKPVDYMKTDLFIFWYNQRTEPDPLVERVAAWLKESFPEDRLKIRLKGEEKARELLKKKAGKFTEEDLRDFAILINRDLVKGKERKDRFMPGLYGHQINQMASDLGSFNRWVKRIWESGEDDLDSTLDAFWEAGEVSGAGTSLPTALLYLRDPKKFNVWLPIMEGGLSVAAGFDPGRKRRARAYRLYNENLIQFRDKYGLPPQSLDVILWYFAKLDQTDGVDFDFAGFTEETFQFLKELEKNNSKEWMNKDDGANKRRYQEHLREPLRQLFQAVAPKIQSLDPSLETEAKSGKVMAGFYKRFPDEKGDYYPYLWGAFYRRDRKKQTDAQLFINVHTNHVNIGLSVAGSRGSDVLANFQKNLREEPKVFLELIKDLPDNLEIVTAEGHGKQEKVIVEIQNEQDIEKIANLEVIDIQRRYLEEEDILYTPDLALEAEEIFVALHPLFRFITIEDTKQLIDLIDEDDLIIDEVPQGELYTVDAFAQDTFLDDSVIKQLEFLLRDKRQLIFFGPPGTGKTWIAKKFAKYWVDSAPELGGEVRTIQFHPSYAYEEFMEGIRPESVEIADGRHEIAYPVRAGVFREFCDKARAQPQRRFMLIVDEINRGELPRIFGELMYLLEYRQEVIALPYSKQSFSIPQNVFILGTMNTADRSIALVDHALRRRFHFFKLVPSPEILRSYLEATNQLEMIWAADLLDEVNRQLESDGIEWHLHVGHSHFMRPALDETQVRMTWRHSIMPTLEEYFYRQPERLGAYQIDSLLEALGVIA